MTTTSPWRMTGELMETCSCNVTCPCNFGGGPTQTPCEVMFGFHIQEGNHGSTPLNGLNLVIYARIPGLLYEGNWTLGVYLDDRANPDQAGALGNILSGQAGGVFEVLGSLIGNPLPPKQVPINYETVDGGHHFTVPGLAEIESERIPHPMPGQPALDTQVTGVAVPFYSSAASIRRAKVMKLTDPELSFEYEGSSSLIGQFDFSGP